jgi:hypothetical protein
MITIKRINTLSKEAYERYRQDPRHSASQDREAFCDAVKAVVVTGLVFEAAQIVLGAAEAPADEVHHGHVAGCDHVHVQCRGTLHR